MQNDIDAPRRIEDAAAPRSTGATQGRVTRLGLSIGGSVLSLAALQSPVLAGPCSSGVMVESPHDQTAISADGAVSCIVLPGGHALLSLTGHVTPLVPLGAPTGSTTYAYDGSGQLPSVTDSRGTTTFSYQYDGGPLTSSTGPAGRTTTYTYQASSDLLTSETLPSGRMVTYQYDSRGQLTSETFPSRTITFTYNAGTVTETAPGGRITTYSYDARDRITQEDHLGRVITYGYNSGGELTNVTDPLGRVTTYGYNSSGVLQSQTDPALNTTTFSYDSANQLLNDDGNYDHVVGIGYAPSVPEPSTLALFLSGLAGWVGLHRRRR